MYSSRDVEYYRANFSKRLENEVASISYENEDAKGWKGKTKEITKDLKRKHPDSVNRSGFAKTNCTKRKVVPDSRHEQETEYNNVVFNGTTHVDVITGSLGFIMFFYIVYLKKSHTI